MGLDGGSALRDGPVGPALWREFFAKSLRLRRNPANRFLLGLEIRPGSEPGEVPRDCELINVGRSEIPQPGTPTLGDPINQLASPALRVGFQQS